MNINYLVHNTLWVPGHFHLTVGTAFALTIMAISYWLVPQITGKRLQIAIGSTLLFLVVMFGTWLGKSGAAPLSGPEGSPRVLDNLKVWTAIAVVLVALAYGLPIWSIVSDGLLTPGSPPIPV